MTTNQTIDGVPRDYVLRLTPEAHSVMLGMVEHCLNVRACMGMDEGVKDFDTEEEHDFVKELRALLDAPVDDQPASDHQFYTAQLQARAAKVLGLDPENTSWFEVVGEMEKAAQPQGEPVAWRFRVSDSSDWFATTKASVAEMCHNSSDGGLAQPLYAEQPAPVAVMPTYKPGLYAVRHIDNWDGERDVALTFAMLDADGKWTDRETGDALLAYRGDKILRAWPLDCSEAPDAQIIGVPRDWLQDWAMELVLAAQDGGAMSNQVEHLLQLHPKQ